MARKTHEIDNALHALLDAFISEDTDEVLIKLEVLRSLVARDECAEVSFHCRSDLFTDDCYTIGG